MNTIYASDVIIRSSLYFPKACILPIKKALKIIGRGIKTAVPIIDLLSVEKSRLKIFFKNHSIGINWISKKVQNVIIIPIKTM